MGKRTPLYECHVKAQAKMVDFAGWDMPLHYGSQLEEHKQVRQAAGVFDVSHMTIVDMEGKDSSAYLRHLLANNIDKLTPGKALYTCMLNEQGGIIDDLIVYQLADYQYRLIVNSATHDKDLAWLTKQAKNFQLSFHERADLAMLAIQGPQIREKISRLFNEIEAQDILKLAPFHAATRNGWLIARTGYTGEDGFEIMLPAKEAASFWNQLLAENIKPCGLGARDTLRLEAGLNLYGVDMDETVTPLESNLAWTIAWEPKDRDFIGRKALEQQLAQTVKHRLVGLVLEGPGVLRNHQKVLANGLTGEITSGSFSPTLGKGIALARIPAAIEKTCMVEIRDKQIPAQIIKPPFVRKVRELI